MSVRKSVFKNLPPCLFIYNFPGAKYSKEVLKFERYICDFYQMLPN